MKNLDISQTGTYYCAVAACGHILFGGGATLEFEDDGDSRVLVDLLCGALAFSTFLAVCLAFCVCTMNSRHNCHCDGMISNTSCLYLRGRFFSMNRMQTENIWTECVYFTGKH
uniref:Immunoglobulin V-set domain-containing protein n=1 Tax=Tetraodon nigroviridis TaxID=99883 RepID=H3BWA9_TETNG